MRGSLWPGSRTQTDRGASVPLFLTILRLSCLWVKGFLEQHSQDQQSTFHAMPVVTGAPRVRGLDRWVTLQAECPSGAATEALSWALASEWMKSLFIHLQNAPNCCYFCGFR